MHDQRTLVLGATGKTGSRVLAGLRQRGESVRPASRASRPAFDWHEPSGWDAVLDGITAVYIASPVIAVPDVAWGRTVGFAAAEVSRFTEVAVAAGVTKIVQLAGRSARHDSPYMVALEAPVRRSGTEWTILRPGVFQQNFVEEPLRGAVARGTVQQLDNGGHGLDFIDVADIADVAVTVLTTDGHGERTYELSGPRAITFAEAVEIIARTLGRDIAYSEIGSDEWARNARAAGVSEETIDFTLVALKGQRNGFYATPFDGVQQVLGRRPREFEAFVRESAATGAWAPPLT